jgi:hypothetical protein
VVLALVARGGRAVLAIATWPPVVTDLLAHRNSIEIRADLLEPLQSIGRWDASNLAVFLVASLGLVLAAPSRDAKMRLAWIGAALWIALLTMIAVCALEAEVATVNYAAAKLDWILIGPGAQRLLEHALTATDAAVLLVPAAFALAAYVTTFAEAPRSTTAEKGIAGWLRPTLVWLGLLLTVGALLVPFPAPGSAARIARLERTVGLNPTSPSVRLALARSLEAGGRFEAARQTYREAERLAETAARRG